MKEKFGGNRFWRKCRVRLDKKEQERKMVAEREKFFERTKRKKAKEYEDKMEFYEMKIKVFNDHYYKRQQKIRDKMS